MTEAEWLECGEPTPMLMFFQAKVSDRKLRLFGVACCRQVLDKVVDARCEVLIEGAEDFADARTNRERAAIHTLRRLANGLLVECAGSHSVQAVRSLLLPSAGSAANASSAYAVSVGSNGYDSRKQGERAAQVPRLRDIFGNPFRPATIDRSRLTSTVTALAQQMYESRDFSPMPILADALQDAGCESADVLDHCRGPGPHVRGCFVVDLVLGKE